MLQKLQEQSQQYIDTNTNIRITQTKPALTSSKDLIPSHTKVNLSRRQTLNYVQDLLNQTRKLTSNSNISFNDSISNLSRKNKSNKYLEEAEGSSNTFNAILGNISKIDMKKKKKKNKRKVSSSDEEDYSRRKPQLQMVEVDLLRSTNAKAYKSKEHINKDIDEFMESHKSIKYLSKSGKSRKGNDGDISLLDNMEDIDESFSEKGSWHKNNNNENQGTSQSITDVSKDKTNENLNANTSYRSVNSNSAINSLSHINSTKSIKRQGNGSSDDKENIYSFRKKKQDHSSDSGSSLSDSLTWKTPSLKDHSRHLYPEEDYFEDEGLMVDDNMNYGISNKKKNDRDRNLKEQIDYEAYGKDHPDYNIRISDAKKGKMLYRIRNRIMVSMISIHKMTREHPTTNQEQINVRFQKQNRDLQDTVRMYTARPRWNSPQGYQNRDSKYKPLVSKCES